MAASGPGRRYSWVRAVIRKAAAVLLLLGLAALYGLVVEIAESVVPYPFNSSCPSTKWADVISVPLGYNCEWQNHQVRSVKRSIIVQLTETSHNALTATVDISTVMPDPLVGDVRRGDAQQDPGSFVTNTVGFLEVAGQLVN